MSLILHGSGLNTRRYLFAADAADAFDTILHRGKVGEIYNVDSIDEISNIELARKLLSHFDIPPGDENKWIQHVTDRPFNDMRYAVDARKLRGLGWTQKVGLEEGLTRTVEWYKKWGTGWWGDVSGCLSAFPEVSVDMQLDDYVSELGTHRGTPLLEKAKEKRKSDGTLKQQAGIETVGGMLAPPMPSIEAEVGGKLGAAASAVNAAAGKNPRKRAREIEGKENEDVREQEGGGKRILLVEGLGDDEIVR
jgi:GDP-mannose 4,6 dehydratase